MRQAVRSASLALAALVLFLGCGQVPAKSGQSPASSGSRATPTRPSGEALGPSAAATGVVAATEAPGSTDGVASSLAPAPSIEPLPSGWPEFPEFEPFDPNLDLAPAPLPEPTMTEPFAIGEALYDPNRVPGAVVSLLDLMGVGIYAADGTAIRRGDEHDANDLWLTEDEVRGLVEMGVADAEAQYEDDSGPFTFENLAGALAPLLPGWSAAKLSAAYDGAYFDRSGDLVPTVMLGQPIEPGTPLTRVQIWLLFVDGFLAPGLSTAIIPGAQVAAAAPTWGTANASLPRIPSPDPSLTADEWALLLAHLAVIGWTIPFDVDPLVSDVHEGHGGPGPSVAATARIDLTAPLRVVVSPITGRLILSPRSSSAMRGSITWSTSGGSVLSAHGGLTGTLGVPVTLGSSGTASIGYLVRQEPADGHGEVVSDSGDLTASIPLRDLVLAAYDVPSAAQGLLFGSREATGRIRIVWHAREGIRLTLTNKYAARLGDLLDALVVGGEARGVGDDTADGFLEKQADGTFRGVLNGYAVGQFQGEWAGAKCQESHRGSQRLYVVGVPASGYLQLSFYPESRPSIRFLKVDIPCPGKPASWEIGWEGGGPHNRPPGTYLPFGTARWTNPSIGYAMRLPSPGDPELVYTDHQPTIGIIVAMSTWYVRTEYVGGTP